jgi:hypothetical protein
VDVSKLVERGAIAANGVWAEIEGGMAVFITSATSIEFVSKRERLEKNLRKRANIKADKDVPIEDAFELTKKAAVGTVLRGWRGVRFDAAEFERVKREHGVDMAPPPNLPENGSGELPYTDANALWVFAADPTFWKVVSDLAGDSATFDAENLEIVGKAS